MYVAKTLFFALEMNPQMFFFLKTQNQGLNCKFGVGGNVQKQNKVSK